MALQVVAVSPFLTSCGDSGYSKLALVLILCLQYHEAYTTTPRRSKHLNSLTHFFSSGYFQFCSFSFMRSTSGIPPDSNYLGTTKGVEHPEEVALAPTTE